MKGIGEKALITEPFEVCVKSFHRFLWALYQIISMEGWVGEKILCKVIIYLFLNKEAS